MVVSVGRMKFNVINVGLKFEFKTYKNIFYIFNNLYKCTIIIIYFTAFFKIRTANFIHFT